MANVALVEKVESKTDFIRHFENDFQFDLSASVSKLESGARGALCLLFQRGQIYRCKIWHESKSH